MIDLLKLIGFIAACALIVSWWYRLQRRRLHACLAALANTDLWLEGRNVSTLAKVPLHSVYVMLDGLEEKGLATSEVRPGDWARGQHLRRFYRITVKGKQVDNALKGAIK